MAKKYWLRALGVALLAAILLWLGLPAAPVQAHANLISSHPAPGDVLAAFPTPVEMEFSEAVAPGSVRAELLNAGAQVLSQGRITLSADNPLEISITFPTQPEGVYSIRWEVQSAQDGHITSGTLPFSVGLNTPAVSRLPPPGAPDPASDWPPAADVLLRGLGYIAVALLAGPVLFGLLVWRPAYRQAGGNGSDWDAAVSTWLRRWIQIGGLLGIASLGGLALWQAAQLSRIAGPAPGGELLASLPPLIGLRAALLAALTLGARFLPPAGAGSPRRWWLALAGGGGLILTYALSGHNAAAGSALGVAADGLHLTAMAAWIGGLLPLAIVLLRQREDLRSAGLAFEVTRRFSRLALTAVIGLGASGLISALIQVQTLAALLGTRYGQTLLIKTSLFAVLIGFGAVNQKILLPKMACSGGSAFRWLGRSVWAEIGLATGLLFAAGALMSSAPANAALKAEQAQGYHQTYRAGQVQIDLRIAPAVIGQNEFGVDVQDQRPRAGQEAPTVLLRFHLLMEGMDMGATQVSAAPTGGQRYTVRGSYLSISGLWQVTVIVRKAGFDDVQHDFTINLEQDPGP
jgi:copper transport protein